MRTRLKLLTVGLVLVTAAVAGCSSTTEGPSGAVQDDVPAAADAPVAAAAGASCASGGQCQEGETGPGGGTVFYAGPFSAPGTVCGDNCFYLEAQPSSIGSFPWCEGPGAASNDLIGATGMAIGTGYSNTQAMLGTHSTSPAEVCTSGAANEAVAPWGGYSDWYLPAVEELQPLFEALVISPNAPYWTSTQDSPNKPQLLWSQPGSDEETSTVDDSDSASVIPIRAF